MDLPPSISQTHGRTATSYCNRRLPESKATCRSDDLRSTACGSLPSLLNSSVMSFQLAASYEPRGDQDQAISKLTRSLVAGNRHQTLLGVTGSGKTFTIANVIKELDRPTLVMSHNKTLAAQLYSEFRQFSANAVEYFVSYFDYYQPEASSHGRIPTLRRILRSTKRSSGFDSPP